MTYRFRGDTPPTASSRASILAPEVTSDGIAELYLYDPIDSWGGWWGVSAKEFGEALALLPDDTTEIRLFINSPGGEVWDAMAIVNQLRRHPARTVAVVDGIAASAASVIAVTCDETVMAVGSQLMIHDAWNIAVGNEADMLAMADRLAKSSNTLAGIYATKAGGDVEDWRELMRLETWYTAAEAVRDGLADRAEGGSDTSDDAKALFDLSLFRYAGRAQAPAPRRPGERPVAAMPPTGAHEAGLPADLPHAPVSSEPGNTNRKESVMADTLKADILKRLGVTDANADDATILAALDEALEERADETAPTASIPEGTVLVDAGRFAELEAQAAAGAQARAQQDAERRDRLVATALNEGRISAANRAIWRERLDADEDGTAALLATLPKSGAVPTEEIGYTGGEDESSEDSLYASIYPATKKES